MSKKTIGALAYESLLLEPETRDPIELQREMQKEYIDNLVECVETNRKEIQGDFYVVVLTKMERLLTNVMRNYFFARRSCPTPDYDQAVYRYNAAADAIEYLWCIPDRDTAHSLKAQMLEVTTEENMLLQHILDFDDGTLYTLAKRLNKEKKDSNIIEK